MEKTLCIEPLQKRFKVSVKDAYKQKRNRSYSNASPCHSAKLKQRKLCSVCDGDVETSSVVSKIIKIGKEEHLINAEALKRITEDLQGEEIKIHTILEQIPEEAEDRFEGLSYALPVPKGEGDYALLRELLKGRVMVGTAVFRNNEFEIVLTVGDDGLVRIRKLVEQSQFYDTPIAEANIEIDGELVDLCNSVLSKKTEATYDFTKFRDARAEVEERIIEDVVLHGKQPEVLPRPKEVVQDATAEKERLKALLGGNV
ncbi:hypothetical protein GOV11_00865 [Candidatus Woesearchaeota archaeon]|nr:hypothetical protein [Candidatus Woesearchaeota archaeon]